MEELALIALNQAELLGASYADIRIVEQKSQALAVKNGQLEQLTNRSELGFGVRVIHSGCWGFAASYLLSPAEIKKITKLAVEIAKSSAALSKEKVKLAPVEKVIADYISPYEKDPFLVPVEEKLQLLLEADKIMRQHAAIAVAKGSTWCSQKWQLFASTEGSRIKQTIRETGAGIEVTAVDGSEVERRSYPNSMGGQSGTRGWELVEELNLPANAAIIRDQAVALLSAELCPSTTTTVILDGSQVALQVHESIGHPTELDRIFGMEASFAGTSFIKPSDLGKLQYGSRLVNVTADATIPGALGSFGYDDEGVPAQSVYLIKDGVLTGFLSSRETAAKIGEKSNGTMRADGFNRLPLIRMTNINLLPGNISFADLIADTDSGIFMQTNKSWSIDDLRLNFQFATEIAWEIKNGKLGKMLRKPNYTGITPQFWQSCDAIADKSDWVVWGTPNCGKGEPMQVAHVAHGAAAARFRNVKVGIGR